MTKKRKRELLAEFKNLLNAIDATQKGKRVVVKYSDGRDYFEDKREIENIFTDSLRITVYYAGSDYRDHIWFDLDFDGKDSTNKVFEIKEK